MMYISCVLLLIISSWLLPALAKAIPQTDISGLVGSTVRLPCTIDTKTCGALHSVKWYRGSSRIFVYSEVANITKSEGEYELRTNFLYRTDDVISYLEVKNIALSDESIYKCELTYLDVVESCLVVQFINLTTLIAPNSIKVYDHKNILISSNSAIGPYNEGTQLGLKCEVGEGKPVPSVQWFKNGQLYSDTYVVKQGTSVIGSAENKISITLSRDDSGAVYECQASSQALQEPLKVNIAMKVHVKPLRMELKGFDTDFKQNKRVELECTVYRALPAASVAWFNETRKLEPKQITIEEHTVTEKDNTITTISRLKFTATRFENAKTFSCAASNDVMKEEDKAKYEKKFNMRVLYPPIIITKPNRTTVNESEDVTLRCDYIANPSYITGTSWYFNGSRLPDKSPDYVIRGGTLLLNKVNRNSLGKYFCSMSNDVGTTNSSEIFVNVQYPPTVEVHSDRTTIVNESDNANITLFCRVKYGNPTTLITVTWYLENVELYEYPNVSNLVLVNVQRGHHGNYSCRGQTEAGIGFASSPMEVFVQYRPGPANISYWLVNPKVQRPQVSWVVKGSSIVLQCNVENLGRPRAEKYNWYEGNRRRENENGVTLTLERVGVKEATNLYSCNAENTAGTGPNGSKSITIYAPPSFINTIKYANPSITDKSTNLTCDIECYPLCEVKWKRNSEPLGESRVEYKIITQKNNASLDKNDFESITSTLVLDLTQFPGGHATPYRDDATYTCYSTGNLVGPGVVSDNIEFRVHFPPQKVVITTAQIVDVIEGRVPGKVHCSAEARPEANIRWYNSQSNVSFADSTLRLENPLFRESNNNFTCEASNKYGNNSTWVFFNIKFKPECRTTVEKDGSKMILTCTANANPSSNISYKWTVDESEQHNIKVSKDGSVLEIEGNSETRVYNCTAENEVGISEPCMTRVPASDDWIIFMFLRGQNWSLLYVIVALVIVAVLAVLVCVLIVILCRKRKAKEKCPGNLSDKCKDDHHSPTDALLQPNNEKGFYENLPFHGMQNPPNKPFKSEYLDLDYADVDYRSYGPINYKAASIYEAQKRNNDEPETEPEDYPL